MNESYKRDVIVARVVELRDQHNMSFSAIANTLNTEGYQPRTAKAFSGAVAFALYNNQKNDVVAA
jgi:hypothetical protein